MSSILAPSGIPEIVDLRVVGVLRIAIEWEELACQDHNGEITAYIVEYSSTRQPHGIKTTLLGSNNTRLELDGLLPRTNYTFTVRAVGDLALLSSSAHATESTSTPTGQYCATRSNLVL